MPFSYTISLSPLVLAPPALLSIVHTRSTKLCSQKPMAAHTHTNTFSYAHCKLWLRILPPPIDRERDCSSTNALCLDPYTHMLYTHICNSEQTLLYTFSSPIKHYSTHLITLSPFAFTPTTIHSCSINELLYTYSISLAMCHLHTYN